ncbi:MAG: chemotaxis protein CheD [Deltaproteobacteria bacterium]|nr:chemotaxis protein CheD [Deltaproteobacteria bacterium]
MNLIVGVSDMKVSSDMEATLVTYSLGSCIGIAVYDSVARVGGLLHYMLPESSLDPIKAKKNPHMFADTGIPSLFKAAYKLGAKKQRLKVIVIGGSQILDQKGFFNIGKRNETAARKMFHKNNVIMSYKDVGGVVNRTVKLVINNGDTWIKVSGKGEKKI